MLNTRTANGFPAMFTNLVAEAAMQLPPLTKPEQFEFLREILGTTIEGFWDRYVAGCPEDVQRQIKEALEKQDMNAVQSWHDAHANFAADPIAAKKANALLDEIAVNIGSLIKEAYEEEFATS